MLRLEGVSGQAFAFWPDSSKAAVCIRAELQIHRLPEGGLEHPPVPLPSRASALSISPSGRRLAVAMTHSRETTFSSTVPPEGRMLLLDMEDPALTPQWLDNPVYVVKTAWHPREDWLAVPGQDQTIRIWDVPGKKVRQTITGPMDEILEAIWSPQGDLMASRSKDGAVKLWDASTGEHYVTVRGSVRTLQFSPDGTRLGVDYEGTSMRLLEVAPLQACRRLQSVSDGQVYEARWSPDGSVLAATGYHVRFWNAAGRQIGQIPFFHLPKSVLFQKDALIVSGGDGVWRWPMTIETRNGVRWAVLGEPQPILREKDQQFAALSADGTRLVVARAKDIAVFDLSEAGAPPRLLPGPGGRHIALTADGTLVATDMARNGSDVLVRRLPGGEVVHQVSVSGVATVGFTYRNTHLITGGWKEFSSWDMATWKLAASLPCQGLSLNGTMALSPRGTAVALGWTPHRTRMVVPSTFEVLGEPEVGSHAPLCFSPDGVYLLTTNLLGNLYLWNMAWIRHEVARLKLDWTNIPELPLSHAPFVEGMTIPSTRLSE